LQARKLARLIAKDFRVEARERHGLLVQAGFTAAAAVLVAAAAATSAAPAETLTAGLILVALFQGLFAGYSAFLKEAYRGTLDGLRLAPVERWTLAASKLTLTLATTLAQLLAFTLIAAAFTPGLQIHWASLAQWAAATSLFMAAVSAFVSAGMAFAEERSTPLALLILVLSIPYLRAAAPPLQASLQGVAPQAGELGVLWLVAAAFTGLSLALASIILE